MATIRLLLLGGPSPLVALIEVGGQAVLGRQLIKATPWLTERHGYDPTFIHLFAELVHVQSAVSRRPTGLRKTIN